MVTFTTIRRSKRFFFEKRTEDFVSQVFAAQAKTATAELKVFASSFKKKFLLSCYG